LFTAGCSCNQHIFTINLLDDQAYGWVMSVILSVYVCMKTFHRILDKNNVTGATDVAGTAYPSRTNTWVHNRFIAGFMMLNLDWCHWCSRNCLPFRNKHLNSQPIYSRVHDAQPSVFCATFCGPLFVFLSFWPLYCLLFSDLWLQIFKISLNHLFINIFTNLGKYRSNWEK